MPEHDGSGEVMPRTFRPMQRVVISAGVFGERTPGVVVGSQSDRKYAVHTAAGTFDIEAIWLEPDVDLEQLDLERELELVDHRRVFLIERVLVRWYGRLSDPMDRERLARQIVAELDRAA